MKLLFPWHNDGAYHQYCCHCHAETIERTYEMGKTYYVCSSCGQRGDRSIVIDPGVKWWVANDGEYWHESAGVFVRNPIGEFLFYERTIFPFALTVPSGHVDAGEEPLITAIRETEEEVGIQAGNLIPIADQNIVGDSCRRGADCHRWHAFLLPLGQPLAVQIKEEGEHPVWLTLSEALQKDLTYPVRYIISHFQETLLTPDLYPEH